MAGTNAADNMPGISGIRVEEEYFPKENIERAWRSVMRWPPTFSGVLGSLLILMLTANLVTFPTAHGQTMADYTAYPAFLRQTVAPNVLIVVDFSEAMLPAAYGNYPESSGGKISSNVNGTDLCNTNTDTVMDPQPLGCPSVNEPADVFDKTVEYFGMFSPFRCYTYSNDRFTSPVPKASFSSTCASSEWDGNFLNWLTMRKLDLAKKVIIGGKSVSANNLDGTVNELRTETQTTSTGSASTCLNASDFCFRYVKRASGAGNHYPSTLPKDVSNVTYFGLGEGFLYASNLADATAVFGSATTFELRADLSTESDAFRKQESLGLVQNLKEDTLRVATMVINAGTGKAATVVRHFDQAYNSAIITTIRNTPPGKSAPLGESAYEGLCYFRMSQGPCYDNTPVDFELKFEKAFDPYYFVSLSRMVACCKSHILLVSAGRPSGDGDAPDQTQPFGNLFASDTVGLSTSWLDDVAWYGKTNDLRGTLQGTQDVTFYSVNAMGDAQGAAVLASAAKYGGFEDQNGNSLPDATGQSCTYPAGSLLGSGTASSNAEWDENQDCVPDTYFEATGGKALEAQLNRALQRILEEAQSGSAVSVLASSSTGDGALYRSFFFPSTFEGIREVKWTGYTQGLFLDSFGNVREDTDGDGRLIYDQDVIIRTRLDASTNELVVDRLVDSDGNGLPDGSASPATVKLRDVKGIWEGGEQLAKTVPCDRRILTWIDENHDKVVDGSEQIVFNATCLGKTDNRTRLAPYLRAGSAPYTAAEIIDFIRGQQISGLRDRELTVDGALKVWKLGDIVHSSPTVVGAPAQRYDIIYGDSSYTAFLNQYMDRRQVAYIGANDGILHAFDGGFFHRGDDPATPAVEHGYFTETPTGNVNSPPQFGTELFGFIPQELLPHLRWLADPAYTHVYYVDLQPKATDVRIFTPDTDHPNGWGTILIGGFRLGGSCGTCTTTNGAPPMTVTADFNGDGDTTDAGDTRTSYSAYFVLDITNPESPDYPKLLWSFASSDLGLTAGVPSMLRVSPSSATMTDNTDAKWFLIAGSGPTGYDGSIAQEGKFFAIDLATGPGVNNADVTVLTGDTLNTFLASTVTVDRDFDYRVDVTYTGGTIHDGKLPWRGKLYRLAMNACGAAPCSPDAWGIAASGTTRQATELLDLFPSGGTTELGPVTAAPTATIDEANRTWVFAGTGRLFDSADKADTNPQYFVGLKDSVLDGLCAESSRTSCLENDLVDVSSAQVCVVGTGTCGTTTDQVTGVTGATDFPSLISLVASKDGWFTSLGTAAADAGERVVARPIVVAGLVLFPSFIPDQDVCTAFDLGRSRLYALYYRTGSAYSSPVVGTTSSGGNTVVNRSVDLGQGMATQAVIHVGRGGQYGKAGVFSQSSTGELYSIKTIMPVTLTSRLLSWLHQRE